VKQLDPLGDLRRTHYCGDLRADEVGREVAVCGWVARRRDHGGVIFVDLRDRSGVGQVVFKPDTSPGAHEKAQSLRAEYVIAVRGRLERRTPENVNPNLPTGEVELVVDELRVLNTATTPPFPLDEPGLLDEAVRLTHRIHDLRRAEMQRRLAIRHQLYQSLRAVCTRLGMYEIETPILARATPEGARDFLVPSRLSSGEFYALPQSPQLMKQLLMVAGYDRYFQIARCFRDEDLRADRQPEFTQLDLELSFVGVDDVLEILEEITASAFADVIGTRLQRPFPRLSYAEAMLRYGSDKPDLRNPLELVELSDAVAGSQFKVFADALAAGGVVRGLPVPAADSLTRGDLDRLEALVKGWGARGLAWVRVGEDGRWQSPIAKFLSDAERTAIGAKAGLEPGHLIFFAAGTEKLACTILGRLRDEVAARLGRVDTKQWAPLLVLEFPLFEQDEQGKISYMHMPFVAPVEEDVERIAADPMRVRATHYDLVLNGVELGSGSLRNHRSDVQLAILSVLGYSEADARQRFGFLLDSLDAGAPPHGGFAFGIDRLCLLLAGGGSLRDVIAFPKTQRGQDAFMQAPSPVPEAQLRELGLRLRARPSGGPESA
jgi:aspartyl-tRNA synthetase